MNNSVIEALQCVYTSNQIRSHTILKYLLFPTGPISDHLMDDMASATPTNTRHDRKYDGEAPSMLPETRKKLEDFYAPFNKKLALLLNDKRYEW